MEQYQTKTTEMLEFKFRNSDLPIQFPVATICGKEDGPTLLVVGGMHGSEFCGVQAAIDTICELDPAKLKGKVVVCSVYNKPAFENHMGFVVPMDGINPGRTFPGRLNGTYSEVMAHYFYENVVMANKPDFLIELHGGDIPEALTPFVIMNETGDEKVDSVIREMAFAYDIPLVIHTKRGPSAPGALTSLFAAASLDGIPAMLTESGQQGILNMDDAARHKKGIFNVMKKLGMLEGDLEETCKPMQLEFHGAIRNTEGKGLWYPFVTLNQKVTEGEVVGEISDYFGNKLRDVVAPITGLVTVVRTSPSVDVNVLVELHHLPEGM